jgi:hypothetical protein
MSLIFDFDICACDLRSFESFYLRFSFFVLLKEKSDVISHHFLNDLLLETILM